MKFTWLVAAVPWTVTHFKAVPQAAWQDLCSALPSQALQRAQQATESSALHWGFLSDWAGALELQYTMRPQDRGVESDSAPY